MDLGEVNDIARKMLKKHNVKDWTFKYKTLAEMNTKGKYVLGRCDYVMKDIILCRELTQHETNIDRVRNTLLHEIAHALDFNQRGTKSGHDKNWVRIAKSIGCAGNKCGDISGVSLMGFAKWIARCPKCKKKYYKMVKPKTRMSCGKCGGGNGFNPDFLLDYKLNPKVVKTYESFKESRPEINELHNIINIAVDEGLDVYLNGKGWNENHI